MKKKAFLALAVPAALLNLSACRLFSGTSQTSTSETPEATTSETPATPSSSESDSTAPATPTTSTTSTPATPAVDYSPLLKAQEEKYNYTGKQGETAKALSFAKKEMTQTLKYVGNVKRDGDFKAQANEITRNFVYPNVPSAAYYSHSVTKSGSGTETANFEMNGLIFHSDAGDKKIPWNGTDSVENETLAKHSEATEVGKNEINYAAISASADPTFEMVTTIQARALRYAYSKMTLTGAEASQVKTVTLAGDEATAFGAAATIMWSSELSSSSVSEKAYEFSVTFVNAGKENGVLSMEVSYTGKATGKYNGAAFEIPVTGSLKPSFNDQGALGYAATSYLDHAGPADAAGSAKVTTTLDMAFNYAA